MPHMSGRDGPGLRTRKASAASQFLAVMGIERGNHPREARDAYLPAPLLQAPNEPDRLALRAARIEGREDDRNVLGDRSRHGDNRSEEHTSELQSRLHLVCCLLLEKKKN